MNRDPERQFDLACVICYKIMSTLSFKIMKETLKSYVEYSKTCLKPPIGFQDRLSLNAGEKYCRMLQGHSAILSTFIKLPFVIIIFALSIFEWPLKTGFTVVHELVL